MKATTDIPYGVLYLIRDKRTNDPVYVGQSSRGSNSDLITLENGKWVATRRIGGHKRRARNGGEQPIHAHMHEQGFDNFRFINLRGIYYSKKDLNKAEKRAIRYYNTFHGDNPNAFNMTRGGQSGKDFVSQATRDKISVTQKTRLENMTPAQKKQASERQSASHKVRHANMTPAQKKQASERQSVSQKVRHANMTPAQKKQASERQSASQKVRHANMSSAQKAEMTHARLETRQRNNPNREVCVTPECLGRPRRRKHFECRCSSCFEQAWMEDPSIGPSYAKCEEEGCVKPGYRAGLCNEHYYAKRNANESPATRAEAINARLETLQRNNPDRDTCVTPGCIRGPRKRKHLEGRCYSCFEQAWMKNPSIGPSYAKCKEEGCVKPGYTTGLCDEHYQAKRREKDRE